MKKKLTFKIEGMTCAVCSASNEKALKKLEGVSGVSVNFAGKTAQLYYDDEITDINKIFNAVKAEGYTPLPDFENENYRKLKQLKTIKIKLMLSLIFASLVLYIAMAPMAGFPLLIDPSVNPRGFVLIQLIFTLAVMAAGYRFYTVGFKNIFKLKPNMDSLVALGTSSAFLFSLYQSFLVLFKGESHAVHSLFYESAAVIIALILTGRYLEMRSIGRAGEAVKKLLDMAPKKTVILRDGFEETVSVSDINAGDILVAKPGDSIAVDGEIVKGSSYIDESMLTGESAGKEKGIGKKVYAGTINKNGLIAYRAENIGKDTVLSKIISIVEEAQGSKAPIARIADRVSAVFVPVVAAIAILSFILWLAAGKDFAFALKIMVSVLVIACPCALGLATPAAIITGTGKWAQLGILFKNAESLENLSRTKAMVFDKTGTLTEGMPYVTDIYSAIPFTKTDVLKYAAAAEKGSKHPAAAAILNEAAEREIKLPEIKDFLAAEGHGVQATADGKIIKAGNISFFEKNQELKKQSEVFINEGKTVVGVYIDGNFAGIIAVRDRLKTDTKKCIDSIKHFGIKTLMLTGDNKQAAQNIAAEAGIDNVIAEVLPNEKADTIKGLKKDFNTAMVGDGINDAPALAVADTGIAIGGGTDIAIESADIVLTGKSLKGVADAVDLSRKVMKNIKENLFWAFFYNVTGIPLAAGLLYPFTGLLLNPMIASLAMSLSSVSVVTNALRLNLYKSRFAEEIIQDKNNLQGVNIK